MSNFTTTDNIKAFDPQGNQIEIPIKDLKFRISVYGLLEENSSLLVTKNPDLSLYSLPGGGVEIGEKIEDALKREFVEETGIEIKIESLFDLKEDFYTFDQGNKFHSILIFYKVRKIGSELKAMNAAEDSVEAKFIKLDELKKGKIDRVFKSILGKL